MFEARHMAPCIIGLLLTSASMADELAPAGNSVEQQPVIPVSVDVLLAQPSYGSRWHVTQPIPFVTTSAHGTGPVADLDFRDSSALSRVGRLRSLSLLTLAKIGKTQVFLGIDDDGLVGLHFKMLRPRDRERHLELLRMSYLKDDDTEDARQ